MMNRLFATLALVALSNSAAALDWSYVGSGYTLITKTGSSNSSDFNADTGRTWRIFEFTAHGLPTGETAMPVCFELEFFDESHDGFNWSQEGLFYCKKVKGSALSESVFARTPVKGDNKTFVCIKNCRPKTPKVLRLKYDDPD